MSDVEVVTKEVAGKTFVLKLIPTMAALGIIHKLETFGPTPEVIFDVISKGSKMGSVDITQKRFDEVFAGHIRDVHILFAEILKYNNLTSEEEGNEEGSEE